ncbi:MAG: VOC family protein [Burkholderiales bacterium]|nr:VOC family protein [Burkholderiales bacterium]
MNVRRFRSARPSNALGPLRRFYVDGLGLTVLAEWQDHEGFDGLVLGPQGGDWQIEFIVERGHEAPRAPTDEHLLVLYVDNVAEVRAAIARMAALGVAPSPPNNPYWSRRGAQFIDPDGYGVVVCTVEESAA